MQDLKDVRYFQIIALVYDKGFHGLHILERGHLFGVKFQQAEALFEQHHKDQVKAARNHAYRHHTFEPAKLLALFDQAHGGKLDAHHHHPMAGQGLRADYTGNLQDAFLFELVDSGADGIFGKAEIVSDFFQRFAPVPQVYDQVDNGLIDFHKWPRESFRDNSGSNYNLLRKMSIIFI